MSRDDISMTPEEIQRYLREGHTMILVSNGHRGHPHAMPMFYAYDESDGSVRFSTYESAQKVKNIERDSRVTLLVESGSAYDELRGVMIEGEAEVSKDLDRTVATMIEAMEQTANDMPDVAAIPEAIKQKMAGKRVLVTVRPGRTLSWDHAKLPKGKTPGGGL